MNDMQQLRLHQFLRSPGGCAFLLEMQAHDLTPEEAVDPPVAIHLIGSALWHLNPWNSWGHDRMVNSIREQSLPLHHLAHDLVIQPGIEQWWAPLQRDRQVWLQPDEQPSFPTAETFPTPVSPPDRFAMYVQRPTGFVSTSTARDGSSTSQLAFIISGASDRHTHNTGAERRHVTVSPDARVLEIVSAGDWHQFVRACPARNLPEQAFNLSRDLVNHPWGPNDGLVPDWGLAAKDWDGVHVTLWAFLTANQVRTFSDAGWTEPWAWEGEETTWLHWVFDEVPALPAIKATPNSFDFDSLGIEEPRGAFPRWPEPPPDDVP